MIIQYSVHPDATEGDIIYFVAGRAIVVIVVFILACVLGVRFLIRRILA